MRKFNTFSTQIFILASLIITPVFGEDSLLVKTTTGEVLTITVNAEDTFQEIMNQINNEFGDEASPLVILDYSADAMEICKQASTTRNYSISITASQKEDIAYIVKTLASSSWTQLLKHKSSLKKAGDRVDNVHPLRFLAYIFTNEELKGGVHSIKSRGGKIWKEFFSGLESSLEQESQLNNMNDSIIQDFAKRVGVNASSITGAIQGHQWSTFMDILLQSIPRGGQPDRYDM